MKEYNHLKKMGVQFNSASSELILISKSYSYIHVFHLDEETADRSILK